MVLLSLLLLVGAGGAFSSPPRAAAPQRRSQSAGVTPGGDVVDEVPLSYPLVGVNIPDLLWDALARPGEGLARGLAAASAACSRNMTLIRFAASPQYPDGVAAWGRNATRYWQLVDGVVHGLAAVGCTHLVPTFFHNPFAFSDFAQSGLGTLARVALNQSASPQGVEGLQLTLAYIDAFVGRYGGLVAIEAWEMGHELNLLFNVDLAVAQAPVLLESGAAPAALPWVAVANGTKAERDGQDSITTELGLALVRAWAARARAADPFKRPVSSGFAAPRLNAQALRLGGGLVADPELVGGGPDSAEQFVDWLNYTHQGLDWISLHFNDVQPQLAVEPPRFKPNGRTGVAQALQLATALAANASKLVFVGQFGGKPNASNLAQPRAFQDAVLDALALLAQGASAEAAAPGAPGVISFGALANWMYGPANASSLLGAIWPGEAAGAIDAVLRHNRLHIEKAACTPGVCCPPVYLAAYAAAKERGLLALGERCAARVALLSQQMFGPPVSFDAFVVVCKGECRRYSAMLRWLQSAADASSCTCEGVFEGLLPGGSYWCPRSPAQLLCEQTGWCFEDKHYENYTCAAGACGRWELNSDGYNRARSKCGVNYDGAAATSLSAAAALAALALAAGAAARWE